MVCFLVLLIALALAGCAGSGGLPSAAGTSLVPLPPSTPVPTPTPGTATAPETPVSSPHPPIRTRFLRNDGEYYLGQFVPHITAYDAAHRQFFVSNPSLNEIDIFDAVQEIEVAQIPVPMPWGIDVSPFGNMLYAGTGSGDIYEIDTVTLQVQQRIPASSIGPSGFAATEALVLSDGRLALLGSQQGIIGVDGTSGAAVWDPVTNSLDAGTALAIGGSSLCSMSNIGAFAVSGDRTRILLADVSDDGMFCSYDPVARVATWGAYARDFIRQIIPTPDGTRCFLTTNSSGIGVFDAKTAQLLGQAGSNGRYDTLPGGAAGAVMSLDGKTLYLVNQDTGDVGGFDTGSLARVTWVPTFEVTDDQTVPIISAIDETGLIVGPIGHGVAFLDSSQSAAVPMTYVRGGYSPGTWLMGSDFADPATGPMGGGTSISYFSWATNPAPPPVSQFYVGNQPVGGLAVTQDQFDTVNTANGQVPPSAVAGPVDLTLVLGDGSLAVGPEGFSYGPSFLNLLPNAATAEGGQQGTIMGYGIKQEELDPESDNSASAVQVAIGGQDAPVTAVYPTPAIIPYPLPVQALQFTIPPGTAGSMVDVALTSASGTATANGAFHYTAALESYPVTATLQGGIYDQNRDLYYFADRAQIQVLSRSTGSWLAPIQLPGTTSYTQLLQISESPDGSLLVASDFGDLAIYVVHLASAGYVIRYPLPQRSAPAAFYAPVGVAITNAGIVYVTTQDISGTGAPAFHKFNTATGAFSDFAGFYSAESDMLDRLQWSPDGSRIYFNFETTPGWLDPTNDAVYFTTSGSSDLAVSGDGNTVDAAGSFADPSLNVESTPAYVDRETWFATFIVGQKLNHDGSIMFQPLTDGIDVIARNTGRLLYRVQLPLTVADVYDLIVVDSSSNSVGIITATGVSFADLSSLPVPGNLQQPFPASAPHSVSSSHLETMSAARRCPAAPECDPQGLQPRWMPRVTGKAKRTQDQSAPGQD